MTTRRRTDTTERAAVVAYCLHRADQIGPDPSPAMAAEEFRYRELARVIGSGQVREWYERQTKLTPQD